MINDIQRLKKFLTFFQVHGNDNNNNGLCYYYASFLGYTILSKRQVLLNYIGNSDLKLFESDYPTAFEFAETLVVGTLNKDFYWFRNKAERIAFLKQFINHLEKKQNE